MLRRSIAPFVTALLDHRANDVRTPKDRVANAWEEWNAERMQHEADETYLQTRYAERHSTPRAEARAALEQFQQAQQLLLHQFKTTQRHEELRTWLAGRLDPRFHAGLQDPVYTKYVHEM
jgi:hypothetical protein